MISELNCNHIGSREKLRAFLADNDGALLGMDFGFKRIGFAVSDRMRIVASPYKTYVRNNLKRDAEYLADLLSEFKISVLVVGLPLKTDDRVETYLYNGICSLLNKTLCPINLFMQDERFSTRSSINLLESSGFNRKRSVLLEDKIAASYILQEVLDFL